MTQKEFVTELNKEHTKLELVKKIHDIAGVGLKHAKDLADRFMYETEDRGGKILSRLKKNKLGYEDFPLYDERSHWSEVKKNIEKYHL